MIAALQYYFGSNYNSQDDHQKISYQSLNHLSIPYLSETRWELIPAIGKIENHLENFEKQPISILGYYYTKQYCWHQDATTVTAYVNIPYSIAKRNVQSKLLRKQWTLFISQSSSGGSGGGGNVGGGEEGSAMRVWVGGELFGEVEVDESMWNFYRDDVNLFTTLIMTFTKKHPEEIWSSLFINEEKCNFDECSVYAMPLDHLSKSSEIEKDQFLSLQFIQLYHIYHHYPSKRAELITSLLQSYYAQCYITSTPSESGGNQLVNVWYLLDPFGTAITILDHHEGNYNDLVNVKCVVFVNLLNGEAISIMWPICDIACGSEIIAYRTSSPFSPPQSHSKISPIC